MSDLFEGTRSSIQYSTSVEADSHMTPSAPTLRAKLLEMYVKAGNDGLTDDEAARDAGVLDTCYWKRCHELRQQGLIVNTGRKRIGLSGRKRIVCAPVATAGDWING